MRVTRSLNSSVVAAILVAVGLFLSSPATAQTPTPTADQLELLKNLTPEQREAIMQQVLGGGGGSSTSGGVTGGTTPRRDQQDQTERADTTSQLDRANEARLGTFTTADGEEFRNGIPLLKGNDWVIVKIDLPPEHPEQNQQGT